jgi:hypothetical protein
LATDEPGTVTKTYKKYENSGALECAGAYCTLYTSTCDEEVRNKFVLATTDNCPITTIQFGQLTNNQFTAFTQFSDQDYLGSHIDLAYMLSNPFSSLVFYTYLYNDEPYGFHGTKQYSF